MAYEFDDMIEDLKKEISDNLTRRTSFTPIEVAKQNHFNFKKKKDKKKFYLTICIIILSFILLVSSILLMYFNKKTLFNYKIDNTINTNVIFKDKDFSNENEATNVYLANLIDRINIDFINKVDYKDEYKFSKNVTASVEIIDANDENNIVFKKTDDILNNNGSIKADEAFVSKIYIDYNKYNNIARSYAKKIKIPYKSRLVVNYTNNIKSKNGVDKVISQKVYIPLIVDTIDITYDYDKVVEDKVVEVINLKGLSITLMVISILGIIPSIVYLINFINKNKNTLTELEKKYKKIMNNYNSIIMEVENNNFDNKLISIDVKYFVDLIDAQQELHVPILCYTDKISGRTWFYIITDKLLYKYELNKSDELI